MAPLYPAAAPQGSILGDTTISEIRPFGLLFPNGLLTMKNETILMRIVSNFRDLKLTELDATQRALIVQYLCFYCEKAVTEEGIYMQSAAAPNSNNTVVIGDELRGAIQQDLEKHEKQQETAHDSMKRKRRLEPSNNHRDGGQVVSKRLKPDTKENEIHEVVQQLEPVQFALSSKITVADIEIARRDFLNGVKNLTMVRGKKKKETVNIFSPTKAVEITNYFFTAMLGRDLRHRISALVEYSNSGALKGVIRASDSRATHLAQEENLPLPLRAFYIQFARAHQYHLQVETPYSTLMRHKEYLALQDEWHNIFVGLGSSAYKKEITKFLKISPSIKKGFKERLEKHVCSALKIAGKKQFGKSMEAQKMIRSLVDHFGYGILVILPPGADKTFIEWGHKRISPIFDLFNNTLPGLRPLCETIATNIYEPMIAGRPLPPFPRNTRELSLEQILQSLDQGEVKREPTEGHALMQEENDGIAEELSSMREPNSQDRW